jgi:hypothetical protein
LAAAEQTMKKTDLIPLAVFSAATFIMLWPETARHMEWLTYNHRYLLGFMSFALLGPLGETAAARLGGADSPRPILLSFQALFWGLYGLGASLFFWLFSGAVAMAQGTGLLPGGTLRLDGHLLKNFFSGVFFTEPFFTSLLVCCCFMPPFLAARRLAWAALNIFLAEGRRPTLVRVSEAADWPDFFRSEAVALPLFRVPCLTFVFMLPPSLWLFTTAWIGVLLGGLIGLTRRKRP